MILWHMGIAAALTYVSLGRRRIDYRFILLGAVAPDVVDGVASATVFHWEAGRGIAHSLLAALVVTIVTVLYFRGERRLRVFGLGVGWLLHLVGDGMWEAPRTFFWPAFGTTFADRPAEPYAWSLLTDPSAHLATWAGELIGLALLAWFWVAFELGKEERFRTFLSEGYLRA